ncbi:MAG TPA: heparinase II/III family protein, partial [Tepidisphaeraceae bacterium]
GEGRGEGAFALIASEKRPHPDPLPGYREREAEAARQKDQLHPADGIVWEFPARGGAKSFALTCGDPAAFAPAEGLSRMCDIRRKFSDVPLEKVRHWVTKWDLQKHPRPITYPAGTAENYQQKLKAWPQLEKRLHETAPKAAETWYLAGALLLFYLGTAPPNPACRAKLFKYIDDQLDAALAHILTNGYIRFIIFDGRSLKVILEAIDVPRWKGEIDQPKLREWSRKAAFLAYAFHDQDFWPYDAFFHARTDQRGHGEEFWSNQGDIICPPNFTTEYWTSFLLAGLTFPEHPAANCWIEKGEEMFARNLDTQFYESGGYSESANYHDHEMQMLTQVAVALLAQGRQDFFEHPRFKKNFGFFIDMITPPVKLTAAARPLATDIYNLSPASGDSAVLLTNWGNSGHDCSGHVLPQPLAVAAGIYADRDPAYARRLMTAWRNSTQKFATSYTGFNLLALGRPDLPETDLHLDSALVEGLGAVMRANVGTPREIFGWIKNGPATHHNCRDDGGLVLYAHGAPVIGDLGYHCQHQGRQEGSFETWKHACVSFDGKTTSMLRDVEFTLPPELWRSTPQADLLVTYAPVDRLLHAGDPFLNPRIVTRIEHRRFTLFMKPDYFVIYDHIPQTTVTSTYWLPALADSIDISAGRAHFHGQFGVDLHLLVLLPAAAKIESGEYSVMRHVRIDQPGAGDYLTVISALPKGEKPPTAKWDASSRMLTVQTGQSEDKIFLSPDYITAPGAPTPIRVAIQRAGQWLSLDSKERNG